MNKGEIVKGRITGIKPYGAFVKLADGTDGLIHISEISDAFVRNIEDFIAVGDEVDLVVLGVSDDQKVSLSFKLANRNKKKKIVQIELKSGFQPLEDMLPKWISEYKKSGK